MHVMSTRIRCWFLASGFVFTACSGDGPSSADTTPPTVVSALPSNGATDVAVDAAISATFSEPLYSQSITDASFTLRPGVTGTVTYDGTAAVFTPATALAFGTTYTATISTAVRDVAGNPLAAPYLWTFTTATPSLGAPFQSVSAGFLYTCGVRTNGTASCWGYNAFAQLGDGTTTDRVTPVGVLGGLRLATVSAARQGYHTCGVTTSGAAYCWGDNQVGQLGDGTTASRKSPALVLGGLSFAAVSTGRMHSCGITTGGAAYCWGDNSDGQLGDGTTTQRGMPTAVLGGLTFVSIGVGVYHTCGVTTGGAAYCWGNDGSSLRSSSPLAVSGGLTFATVSAGDHTCGVTTAGAAYCWGDNFFAQLGDGTTTTRTSPVAVLGGLTFATVSAGVSHTCGVTTAGAAYCWGSNATGQLGDGTTTRHMSPVAVAGGLTFAVVSAGDGGPHTCGVTVDGAAYCWGDNGFGQLGDGAGLDSNVPVKVAGQP